MALEVRPDLLGDKPEPGSDSDSRQLASLDEEIHLPARDGEEGCRVGHRHERCPPRRRTYVLRMGTHEFTVLRLEGDSSSADTSGDLHADAARRFALINSALVQAGEGTVLPVHARRAVRQALADARDPFTTAQAKRHQVAAVGDRPLAVCFGRRARQTPPAGGALLSFGDGCGVIFADSRSRFARYCPNCQRKPGKRLQDEILRQRLAAGEGRAMVRHSWLTPGFAPEFEVAGWRITCSCGERFTATTRQRRRCDNCRH